MKLTAFVTIICMLEYLVIQATLWLSSTMVLQYDLNTMVFGQLTAVIALAIVEFTIKLTKKEQLWK